MILARIGRWTMGGLDALVRRAYGVHEFSSDPGCILRLAKRTCRQHVILADGTQVRPGDRVGELHLWNERLPAMAGSGVDLRWAAAMRGGLRRSLCLIAAHVSAEASWDDVRAFRGQMALDVRWGGGRGADLLTRLGLEMQRREPATCSGRFSDFWENLYTWWLVWTFAPASLRGKRLHDFSRYEIWLSRAALMSRCDRIAHEKGRDASAGRSL